MAQRAVRQTVIPQNSHVGKELRQEWNQVGWIDFDSREKARHSTKADTGGEANKSFQEIILSTGGGWGRNWEISRLWGRSHPCAPSPLLELSMIFSVMLQITVAADNPIRDVFVAQSQTQEGGILLSPTPNVWHSKIYISTTFNRTGVLAKYLLCSLILHMKERNMRGSLHCRVANTQQSRPPMQKGALFSLSCHLLAT